MRKKGLDILRATAIILVLFRHSDLSDSILRYFGWLGVDLFFALSGFLVSGLLFKEYKKHSSVNIKRFLIKRGFKIFPPFYFFLLATLLFHFFNGGTAYKNIQLFSELFYLQSYVSQIWWHTWTLAVEEHFYLTFSILMFILSRRGFVLKTRFIISSLIFLLILSFLMRFYVSYPHRHEESFGFIQSHLRSDGIIMGVLLSYLYYFTNWTNILAKNKWVTLLVSTVLIFPGFVFPGGSIFMNTIGLTTVNLGFTLLVFLSLDIEKYLGNDILKYFKFPVAVLCFIGINSYSIYLWHLNSKDIVYSYFDYGENMMTIIYITFSIVLGILMSYLIEKTFLKLRGSRVVKKLL